MTATKKNGSQEKRRKELEQKRAERTRVIVEKAIQELGIPADSVFLGYVIHNPVTDDYLAMIEDSSHATKRMYSATPDRAIRFVEYGTALAECMKIKNRTVIGLLFDTGNQYAVGFDGR